MELNQKRIRKVNKLLSNVEEGSKFFLGIVVDEYIKRILSENLNTDTIELDSKLFPSPYLGTMSKRNAIGDYKVNKDLPKETFFQALDWEVKDWGGYTHSGTSYIPRERYHRDYIEPKELKLLFLKDSGNNKIVVIDKAYTNQESEYEDIKFGANLMLEFFEKVDTYEIDEENNIISEINNIESVNWEILPAGERIWRAFESTSYDHISRSEQILMKERFEFIEDFNPSRKYKGIGGYLNYVIFEFESMDTYIVESVVYGNATYILSGDWENISKLTKKEILNGKLAEDRIIHNDKWKEKINKYLPAK